MKLVSFSTTDGTSGVGAVVDQGDRTWICDLAAASARRPAHVGPTGAALPTDMVALLELGDAGLDLARAVAEWAANTGTALLPPDRVRLRAPVPRPPKLLALAGNYQEHITEDGAAPVDKPSVVPKVFIKPATTVADPGQTLLLPQSVSREVDWELELAVVVGRRAKYVPVEEALACVAGYTVFNDVSSRSLEIVRSRTTGVPFDEFFDWLNGKWQDGFGPMGPYLVTRDDVPDPQRLALRLTVNDAVQQEASTGQMIFSVAETVSWASQLFTLEPGDVIATGTPAGVGAARGVYLRPGDVVRGEIEGLGVLVTPVEAETAAARVRWREQEEVTR